MHRPYSALYSATLWIHILCDPGVFAVRFYIAKMESHSDSQGTAFRVRKKHQHVSKERHQEERRGPHVRDCKRKDGEQCGGGHRQECLSGYVIRIRESLRQIIGPVSPRPSFRIERIGQTTEIQKRTGIEQGIRTRNPGFRPQKPDNQRYEKHNHDTHEYREPQHL